MRNLDVIFKGHNHAQGIVHNGYDKNHTTVLDTGAQKSMIGMGGWEIIKRHDSWIDAQGVNMGGLSKADHRLKSVDTRGVTKNCLDGKCYLIIIRQAFSTQIQMRHFWQRTKLSVME